MKTVLQKFIADAGFSSRRRAEELIRQGKVKVNKKTAALGMRVDEFDEITVAGEKLKPAAEKIYIILNKPAGFTCSNRKFKGEKNIFELVDIEERLYAAGRLDKDSRGLVLLTNDGALTERLTHPRFEHEKEYLVKISNFRFPNSNQAINELITKFKKGIDIGMDDGTVKAKEAEYLGGDKFKIILTAGKKRQIRRMFKEAGLAVADLRRTRVGSIGLGSLKEGKWRYLDKNEIGKLLNR